MSKLLLLAFALSLTASSAFGATPTPKPTISVKASATPMVSITPKVTATPKTTVSAKATTTATKKPVVKRTYRPRPKPTVTLPPKAPSKWPPTGFISDKDNPDIYAKIPTKKELLQAAADDISGKITKQLNQCETHICGPFFAGSAAGCVWWEFNTDIYGSTSESDNNIIKLGTLTSLFSSTKAQQVITFFLISPENLTVGSRAVTTNIMCHRDPVPNGVKFPSYNYIKNN